MHFAAQKIVLIHLPKTAGNYVSTHLLPHSDDKKVLVSHQDGQDRCGVKGPITQGKHQRLARYVRLIGADAARYTFFSTYRAPVDRMVSYYFSPQRWMIPSEDGTYHHLPSDQISFDLDDFAQVIETTASLWEQLDLDSAETLPKGLVPGRHKSGATIKLMRYSHLASDVSHLSDALGLVGFTWSQERVNASLAKKAVALDATTMQRVNEIVMASKHGKDARLEADDISRSSTRPEG